MNDLISRKDAIEHLKKRLWETALNNEGEAAEVFAGIADDRLDTWMAEIRPAQQWIPVTERLPEDDGRYLVTIKEVGWFTDGEHKKPFKVEHQRIHIEDFFAKDQSFFRPWFTKGDEIVAWMPLPDIYGGYTHREAE